VKILTVVGARPQFIKAAAVSRALRLAHREFLLHTGQHYDPDLSDVFFRELDLPAPDCHLGVGSGAHADQTGRMLVGIADAIERFGPDVVLVYGDTNSTLAGALGAAKLQVPVAHVEAGLRSFNRAMSEEINRVVTDHVSRWLFCSSDVGVENLAAEGIVRGVHVVGDVMADVLTHAGARARATSRVLEHLGVTERAYLLATIHRAENTDDPDRLAALVDAFEASTEPVVFPVHPRTRAALERAGRVPVAPVRMIEPLGYLDTIRLASSARLILTDSGGMQKEAYWLGVPCVTLRNETEWIETTETGWNVLAGTDRERIVTAMRSFAPGNGRPSLYGDGRAAERIAEILSR
jgi:UDP-GlcNAc3NAcA epimerase